MKQELIKIPGLTAAAIARNELALSSLTPSERSIIEAALERKIKNITPVEVVNELLTILSTIYTIAGQKSDPATLALYADELYQKIITTYPNVTVQEIRTALKKGVYEEYGEYYGLNIKTFVLFIRSYLFSEERKAAKDIFESKRLEVPVEAFTPEQKEQTKKEFVNNLYSDFRKGKLIVDFIPSYLCGFLEEKRMIVLSNKEKLEIKNRARSYYNRLTTQERFQVQLSRMAASAVRETNEPEIRITNIARQFAIYEFFERCSSQGASKVFDDAD